ncbi:MAG: flavodoxin family protein [Candidatus Aegiribacteria sp.]|nr:flavodoxin family protein [Candidatus Aegiribacteria sp.]
MKVAAFVGSPRPDGVTDAIVREVLSGAEDRGADSSLFHIGLLHIMGCHACMKCKKTGVCILDDDMKPLFEELKKADCIILGTPIYFYYMTAQMKAFTDRLFSLIGAGFESRLGRKKTVFVVTQGADDPELFSSQIESMINAWCMAGLDIIETVQACALESAEEVMEDEELMRQAFLAGQRLTGTD